MFNLKLTIYGAIFGLIISIFFGLVGGGIQFGVMLLRALISSLLCGGILALASFLFRRFLSEPTNDISSENSTSTSGGLVDITVDEDVLQDSDNAPDFYVSKKYTGNQTLKTDEEKTVEKNVDTSEKKAETTVPEVSNNSESVSKTDIPNSETDSHQFVQTSLVKERYTTSEATDSTLDSLDSLPELGSIVPDPRPQETEVIEDSAFAKGEPSSSKLVPDAAVGADTSLMAEAIKTLLRREG